MINHIVFLTQWFQMYGIWWIYFWRLVQLIRCYLARLTFYRDKKREKMGISESPLLSSRVVLKSCVSGGGISTRWIALDPFSTHFSSANDSFLFLHPKDNESHLNPNDHCGRFSSEGGNNDRNNNNNDENNNRDDKNQQWQLNNNSKKTHIDNGEILRFLNFDFFSELQISIAPDWWQWRWSSLRVETKQKKSKEERPLSWPR